MGPGYFCDFGTVYFDIAIVYFIVLLLAFPFAYSIGTQDVIGVFDVFGSRSYCVCHDECKFVYCVNELPLLLSVIESSVS